METIERERVEGYEHRAPKSRKGAKKVLWKQKLRRLITQLKMTNKQRLILSRSQNLKKRELV